MGVVAGGAALATVAGARPSAGAALAGIAPAGNSSCWPGLMLAPWPRPLTSISAAIDTPWRLAMP
jgi:hypothetical protein